MTTPDRAKLRLARRAPWHRRPLAKFGMLGVIGVLLAFHLWMFVQGGEESRAAATRGLVIGVMLAANHISLAFFSPPWQRRVLPLQLALVVGGLCYVVATSFPGLFGR